MNAHYIEDADWVRYGSKVRRTLKATILKEGTTAFVEARVFTGELGRLLMGCSKERE
jgi:hypothetical protein